MHKCVREKERETENERARACQDTAPVRGAKSHVHHHVPATKCQVTWPRAWKLVAFSGENMIEDAENPVRSNKGQTGPFFACKNTDNPYYRTHLHCLTPCTLQHTCSKEVQSLPRATCKFHTHRMYTAPTCTAWPKCFHMSTSASLRSCWAFAVAAATVSSQRARMVRCLRRMKRTSWRSICHLCAAEEAGYT